MRALALTILAVGVTTALLIWACLHVIRDAEKMQRDPKLLCRRFRFLGIVYIVGCLFGIFHVATGSEPPITLIGLPIGATLAWFWIKQASNVKIPPS